MNTNVQRTIWQITGAVIVLLLVIKFLNISYPFTVTTYNKYNELSVVGEGKVDVVPDTAYVDVGITVNGVSKVDDVQKQINDVNNKIVEGVKKLGISKSNITTSNYSVYPEYRYDATQNTQTSISGYNGNVTITVKTNKVDITSQIIDIATKAGANQVQGVRFSVDKPEKYREEARNKAIKNAKEEGAKLAKDLGIKLGNVSNIIESTNTGSPMYPVSSLKMMDSATGMGGGASSPSIEQGTQTITSTVTLFFEKR